MQKERQWTGRYCQCEAASYLPSSLTLVVCYKFLSNMPGREYNPFDSSISHHALLLLLSTFVLLKVNVQMEPSNRVGEKVLSRRRGKPGTLGFHFRSFRTSGMA